MLPTYKRLTLPVTAILLCVATKDCSAVTFPSHFLVFWVSYVNSMHRIYLRGLCACVWAELINVIATLPVLFSTEEMSKTYSMEIFSQDRSSRQGFHTRSWDPMFNLTWRSQGNIDGRGGGVRFFFWEPCILLPILIIMFWISTSTIIYHCYTILFFCSCPGKQICHATTLSTHSRERLSESSFSIDKIARSTCRCCVIVYRR